VPGPPETLSGLPDTRNPH